MFIGKTHLRVLSDFLTLKNEIRNFVNRHLIIMV